MDEIVDVDYEALCSRLIVENEQLRKLARASAMPSLGEALEQARDFIQNNYLVLLFLLFAASSLISGLYTVYQDRRRP